MIETPIDLRKLTATDGYVLTNGEAYGKEVYLGKNDNPDNWYEITEEEAEKRMNGETTEDEATEADYQNALREMGVRV